MTTAREDGWDSCYYCGTTVDECGTLCPNCKRQLQEAPEWTI